MNPPAIRALEQADFAAWSGLWAGYQGFYKVRISQDVSAQTFRRLLDPAEPMHGALAEREGTPCGLVHWIFHRSCWTAGDYCYLQDLFVDHAQRGGGVGRALIAHAEAAARAAGCARLYWLTHETNTGAMKLYDRVAEKSGFVQYRIVL